MEDKRERVPPSRDVAKQLALEIRLTGFNKAQEILHQLGHHPTKNTECELSSLCHFVLTWYHDRDYRGFYLFAIDYLRDAGGVVRISDVFPGPCQRAPSKSMCLR